MGKIGDLWVKLGLKKDEFTAGLDDAAKQSQTFSQKVGGFFSGLATKVVALTAAFAAIGRAMMEAARNIAGFERANAELAAVLGTNIAGVKELSESAKELGRTSEFTAAEVTSLQTALARLGFDTGQIQSMQKSVLNFALAMGTDLKSAAEFTGASLRAFGLQAEDTGQLLDIMAASTTNSALDFSKLSSSISTVAPIAKSFGLSVQETAAFLGVLANNGFDASSAATALRNILLNLADSNGKLAQGIGHSARTFPEIIKAFQELREKGIAVDEVLAMTDRRSAAAAAALISMGEDVDKLKDKLVDSNGVLNQMAETMGDNVVGSVRALKSAWEGLTLAFEGSKGPMKWVVDRLTDIVNRLTDILSGEKVSFWETILGPITGGAIKGGSNRRKAKKEEAANQVNTEDFALPGGIGGNRLGGGKPGGGGGGGLTDEELEALRLEQNKRWKNTLDKTLTEVKDAVAEQLDKGIEIPSPKVSVDPIEVSAIDVSKSEQETNRLTQLWERLAAEAPGPDEAREAWDKYQKAIKDAAGAVSAEEAEIRKADEAMLEVETANYEAFRRMHDLPAIQPFDNDTIRMSNLLLREAIENGEELEDLGPRLQASLDACTQGAIEGLEAMRKKSEDLSKAIAEQLVSAIEDGLVGAFDALAEVLGGVTEGGMENVAKALLEPLADMAIKAGTLIMMSGEAIQALKESFINFFGGSAVVAGAALVAVGIAAKAGLAALGNRGAGASSVSSFSSSSGLGYAVGGVSTAELVVRVEGEVNGSSIILSGQNTMKEWNK